MRLLHDPRTDVAPADDRDLAADEIIDLTDRRRVLLLAVLGVRVDSDTADAVFERR